MENEVWEGCEGLGRRLRWVGLLISEAFGVWMLAKGSSAMDMAKMGRYGQAWNSRTVTVYHRDSKDESLLSFAFTGEQTT